MLETRLDHLVIVSPSLEAGVEYVRETLGVAPEAGGERPRMGTHNAVLRLGDDIRLEGLHPEFARIRAMLDAIGFAGGFSVAASRSPALAGHIACASGVRSLGTKPGGSPSGL